MKELWSYTDVLTKEFEAVLNSDHPGPAVVLLNLISQFDRNINQYQLDEVSFLFLTFVHI